MDVKQQLPDEPWQLEELAFQSQTAVVGGLIGRFRALWYSVAAKWAVRHLITQQNQINRLIYQSLQSQAAWLSAQDKELVSLRQQLAEVTAQLVQTQKRLAELEEKELGGTEGN